MGRVGLDQRDSRLGCEASGGVVRAPADLVHELHDGRDRRVQREPAADVVGHLRDRLVRLPRQRSLDRLLRRRLLRLLESDPPELLEETDDPLEPVVLPFRVLLDRPDEEQIEPNRIGAVAVDVVVGDDDVPLDLDIFAPFRWSILGEEARERLAEADEPVLCITLTKKRA